MKNPMQKKALSWFVSYWVVGPGTLLGGVKRAQSSRWGEEADAHHYKETVLERNREAGINCDGYVVPSPLLPEIFRHCADAPHKPAQSVGGKCFSCGKKLTRADAREHVPVPLVKDAADAGSN
jgi:hypothetical protein